MLRIAIAAVTIIAFALPASAATVKKKGGNCYKFDQAGRKLYYPCSQKPSMQDEIAAQQRIKANQPSGPTTQQCQMVNGNLVCR
ncbi:hypothetical protein [Bradyrhizobium sp.]|uniref:hypothetical protein n=1 Tax=Bradyrhizobium sp. TaxID=376 RepID=UPI001DA2BDB9|nr:hypothetical protein [Bradyrhizobium sp.]MBI5319382.1 hypothetical protein [Bradyrhizobium sp.]